MIKKEVSLGKKDLGYELSVVVPAYNELKSIPDLIKRYEDAKKDFNFQLVIVDNGSEDGTWDYLLKEKTKKEFIKLVKIKKNIGYGNGIHQGLKKCDAEVIGWSHADLQCPPEDIFKAYKIYKNSKNKNILIKGHRKGRDWKSLILNYGLLVYASAILLRPFDDINGQPKIFPKSLVDFFKNPPLGFSFDLYVQYIALKNNLGVKYFLVNFNKRKFGLSKWAYSVFSKFSTIKSFLIDVIKMRFNIIK